MNTDQEPPRRAHLPAWDPRLRQVFWLSMFIPFHRLQAVSALDRLKAGLQTEARTPDRYFRTRSYTRNYALTRS